MNWNEYYIWKIHETNWLLFYKMECIVFSSFCENIEHHMKEWQLKLTNGSSVNESEHLDSMLWRYIGGIEDFIAR